MAHQVLVIQEVAKALVDLQVHQAHLVQAEHLEPQEQVVLMEQVVQVEPQVQAVLMVLAVQVVLLDLQDQVVLV